MRQFLILAILAIVVVGGVSVYQDILTDILTVPADKFASAAVEPSRTAIPRPGGTQSIADGLQEVNEVAVAHMIESRANRGLGGIFAFSRFREGERNIQELHRFNSANIAFIGLDVISLGVVASGGEVELELPELSGATCAIQRPLSPNAY